MKVIGYFKILKQEKIDLELFSDSNSDSLIEEYLIKKEQIQIEKMKYMEDNLKVIQTRKEQIKTALSMAAKDF